MILELKLVVTNEVEFLEGQCSKGNFRRIKLLSETLTKFRYNDLRPMSNEARKMLIDIIIITMFVKC